MPQPDHISKLGVPDPATLDDDLQVIWQKCVDKLGFVPNVFSTYSLKPQRLRNFMAMYNEIMLSDSGLSKLEREMVAVVVSSANRCYYCLVAHGAAVRALSGDPELGEMMALNYRVAKLDPRQRAMLDYTWKLTTTPWLIDDADNRALLSGRDQRLIAALDRVQTFMKKQDMIPGTVDVHRLIEPSLVPEGEP